ncbi:S41 family peptidase [Paenibacillus sp. YPG26]|uniref:S41 family peptidase n=1 Tax=Paenibacillus sp. YPG26 TaxID=2878915 RepID=UPI00203B79E0|nr:S41 family peptidase [Paenibacillus sp. YPG26]USB32571.1 S41 family peptidase [Paenibacillus sp. YPG26]
MTKFSIRKALISATLTLSLLLLPGAAFAADSQQTASTAGSSDAAQASDSQLIQEVLDYISKYNVSGVKKEELIRAAIEGMIYQLDDPYTSYFTADELNQFQNSINQDYVGIGITLYFENSKLKVDSVISGSPADKSGIQAGDIITKINGVPVTGPETAAELAGEENTKVTVTVQRSGITKLFTVTRAEIYLPTVNAAISDSGIGYIQLTSFAENADEDFADALSNLKASGMKSLVLDLRDNGGGYIDTASNIAKHFIDKGILMYTQDQSGLLVPQVITGGVKLGVPVVILTNENSASASEILTGALRDNHVATTVGTTTYGKARIQNVISLSNGDALKLTTEKYLTPSREDFNEIGLKPDFEVKNRTAQLLTAFSLAGMKKIRVSGDSRSLQVDGESFDGTLDTIKKGNSIYVPARVLTSLVLGEVDWNAKDKKIIVTDGAGRRSGFTVVSNQVIFHKEESYIEIHAFVKKYPSLKWSYSQNKLTLSTP